MIENLKEIILTYNTLWFEISKLAKLSSKIGENF